MLKLRTIIVAFALLSILEGCKVDSSQDAGQKDDFDRAAMLIFWADEIIIPAYQDYHLKTKALQQSLADYRANPSLSTEESLRLAFANGYKSWQWVSAFAIGPAESMSLLNYSNIFPCDTTELLTAITNPNLNLSLPSTFDIQGWPALDYLLYGSNRDSAFHQLQSDPERLQYLQILCDRLESLARSVLEGWTATYRSSFVSSTGSGADAATNKLINDFVFNYEKELRAAKIGIPAGVFSGSPLPSRLEAYFSDTLSKSLYREALASQRAFFEGRSFSSDQIGPSLQDYLDYLQISHNGEMLSSKIINQFKQVETLAAALPTSFKQAINSNPAPFLQSYDALQQNVIWLKVDMMQALNVRVDYVDADGD